jgi:hypothetical protein
MAKITSQEFQHNGDLDATETVALYVNGQLFKEYVVSTSNIGKVKFSFQEMLVEGE